MTKTTRRYTTITLALLTLVTSFAIQAPIARAQTVGGEAAGQALEIAPPVTTLTADPGQTLTVDIRLRNIAPEEMLVRGSVNDFLAGDDENGTPRIFTDEEQEELNNPYSLRSWVGTIPEVILVPREITTLPVTISVPKEAQPGGHYGVIRFTATPPELRDTGVSLSASLGTLVLVTVNGTTTEKLAVEEYYAQKNGKKSSIFETGPVDFLVRLNNTGNTHVQPVGQIVVTDMFGKKIGAVNVNLPPRNILPSSIRRFEQSLDKSVIGNKRLFGKYTAELNMKFGSTEQTVTQKITFWVIPYRLIIVVVLGLVVLGVAAAVSLKKYNQRIISKSRRRW